MSAFISLEDSPMFLKEISFLEQMANELRGRCQRLYKDCKSFTVALNNASDADATFANSLEAFGAGQEDPVSVSIGGPVMSKFINAFRELATYKEFLRSQVEHVLMDQLVHFMDNDLQDVKESRKRFDKAVHAYDQSREKFVSLKKNTREDILEEVEEGLQNSKSAFDKSRFNLVSALMNVEAKKKYEFLESISAIMDAHLRYFKLGYDLFSRLEPFIHQVLSCAQQSKELANAEQDRLAKRIQEFRTQSEMDNARASGNIESSTSADGIHVIGVKRHESIEALMRSTVDGEVRTIKQGYLLKRSSNYRGDWKRKFFVLDSQGSLYYYRNKGTKSVGSHNRSTSSAEQNSGVFGRFRARHGRSASLGEKNLDCRIIDLHTSIIKMDADDADLRLCFRIISPLKTYTLQSENAADRAGWVNKITGVITSLLNSHLDQPLLGRSHQETNELHRVASFGGRDSDGLQHLEDDVKPNAVPSVLKILREVPGNALCAECSASDPDWASLNLGILLCIECSGVHRNLGVHISKVRSLTLDVKVWESTILDLFRSLGNSYCNSIWEGLLLENQRMDESNLVVSTDESNPIVSTDESNPVVSMDELNPIVSADESNPIVSSIVKPSPKDDIHCKEKFIQAKYVEKSLVIREPSQPDISNPSSSIWIAVKENNLREVYRLIVVSKVNTVNTTFDEVVDVEQHHHVDEAEGDANLQSTMKRENDPAACQRIKDTNDPVNCLQGCSLLHLACQCGNPVMLELLIQFGADINLRDFHGRTPLHHCIAKRDYQLAKLLLRRGASPSAKDAGGLSVMERAMEMGAITDEELFIMLVEESP